MIGGRDVTFEPPTRRPTTTMFQDYALFPHMTLGANVGFGLRMRGVGRRDRDAKALEMLELVGLRDTVQEKPHELSGGQRQRVALARALAVEPGVLLLDEPLGALDLKLRRQMQDELKTIQKRVGTTFVHVTHNQEEAMAIADTIIVMNDGVIEDVGESDAIYLRPKTHFAAGFMGEINFLEGVITAADDEGMAVETPIGSIALPAGSMGSAVPVLRAPVTLCIRPEHFRADLNGGASLALAKARVVDGAFFGTHHRCHVAPEAAPDSRLVAHLPQTMKLTKGDEVLLRVKPASIVVLPGRPA